MHAEPEALLDGPRPICMRQQLETATKGWRMWRNIIVLAGIALTALPAEAVTGRREVVPAERQVIPFEGDFPGCDDTGVLAKITARFVEKEAKFWNSSLTIDGYERIQRTAFRPWGIDYIPRRFCTAIALMSDGHKRRIDYSVREDLGIIGATYGVEFCVVGLDRNWAFAPGCRMARP